jgi:hypothetical protein
MLDLEANKIIVCDPAGIRTQDPYIKSVLLYRLSYGIIKLALVYQMAHAGALGKFSHWPTSFCKSGKFYLYCGAKLS